MLFKNSDVHAAFTLKGMECISWPLEKAKYLM